MDTQENFIDHETRIRLLERIAEGIDARFKEMDRKFDKIESKMDSQFHWVLGTILAQVALIVTLFGGIILHAVKLI